MPSPTSTTPAFSPGPAITHGSSCASPRRWIFEDLYEQCSDHITEYMPSSATVGVRVAAQPQLVAEGTGPLGGDGLLGRERRGGGLGHVGTPGRRWSPAAYVTAGPSSPVGASGPEEQARAGTEEQAVGPPTPASLGQAPGRAERPTTRYAGSSPPPDQRGHPWTP